LLLRASQKKMKKILAVSEKWRNFATE